jgi:hypothetical protein
MAPVDSLLNYDNNPTREQIVAACIRLQLNGLVLSRKRDDV